MTQFYSRNDVNYSGDVYSIPFKYIHKKEVKVYIDDELWTKWHFLNTNQLTLDEVPEGIGYNNIVSVRRETDIEEKVVTYDNNSLLNKENLNKSQDQLIYAVQEIYDNNTQFAIDIRAEVDEKVERVSDAVEKLEFLEDSVEIANEAALEATEQAQIATEKAEETLNTYNEAMAEIDTLKQNSIKDIDQLVADHTNDLNSLDATIKKDADAIINRVGFSLFDTVVKDHVLSYEESKGLALQGTWVYKNAIAGERYGYADFYNKCLEEYQNSTNEQAYLKSNVDYVGLVEDNQGILSGFSASNYAVVNKAFTPLNATWEKCFKFNTSNVSTGTIYAHGTADKTGDTIMLTSGKIELAIGYTGSAWNIEKVSTVSISANTDYWVKTRFTGTQYLVDLSTDGEVFDNIITVDSTTVITADISQLTIGERKGYSTPLTSGLIDLNESYININGERWWDGVETYNLYKNSSGHWLYDISEKDKIDEVFNQYGIAWFYGVDAENERIFLPRDNFFAIKGIAPVVGNGMTLGFTTGSLNFGLTVNNSGGNEDCFSTNVYGSNVGSTGTTFISNQKWISSGVTTDPTKSGIEAHIETNEDKYLYICVGNTVADTSWVDVVTQVKGGVKDIEEAKDEAVDAMKSAIGGTVPLGFIGSAILGIDETLNLQRYLNGQIILQDQFKGFTKYLKRRVKLYPSLACAEDEWQTTVTMSAFSQCGKFVIDDNAGTIRLPKVVNIQGLTDLSKLAEIVEAGLPDHSHTYNTKSHTMPQSGSATQCWTGDATGTTSNASASNPIYGNSNTVQEEAIQYPYFIQVATGAEVEDNIINEIELNNPFSLLDYKFSEYELNNISWLRSNGQYNSKVIYPAVYDLLLKIYNGTETKAGVSVKLNTETFTDYDFVLNTAEETFRLPIKVKLASGKAVVGNGTVLGLTNGTVEYGLSNYQGTNIGTGINITYTGFSGQKLPYNNASWGSPATASDGLGVSTDATKSGIETSDSDLYLYFYVGETVQNANLINAGRIEEKIAGLIPDNSSLISGYAMPSSKYIDLAFGASGTTYTAPANGWFCAMAVTNKTTNALALTLNGIPTESRIVVDSNANTTNRSLTCLLPVKRGDVVRLDYSGITTTYGNYTNLGISFIYAEGEI